MGYGLKYSLVQGFCPLKIKITQFPNRFCLNSTAKKTHPRVTTDQQT